MSLSVLRAHVDEMAHNLVRELQRGQGNGGAELDLSKGPVVANHPLRRVTEPADREEFSEEQVGRLNSKDQEAPLV
jgi:hypothetical protein